MSNPRDYVDETKRRDRILNQGEDSSGFNSLIDRISYKYFRKYVVDKEEFLEDYQETLKSAQVPESADLYVSKVLAYAAFTAIATFVTMVVLMLSLWQFEILELFTDDPITMYILIAGTPIFATILFTSIVGGLYYILPSYKSNRRASRIDATLPSAVTFMYALNRGGMNIVEVFRVLAENEEVYGEVSREVSTVVQDMEYFSRDLMEALRRAGERSPSQKFTDLMDDMVSTLDSGASMPPFLENKSDDLIEDAEREQENYIETLGLMGEVYVTAFVAGPLFMIIITVIMSLMGGADPSQLDGIVYGLLPFMNVGYFFLIDIMAGSDPKSAKVIPINRDFSQKSSVEDIDTFAEKTDDYRVKKVKEAKEKRERTALIREPVKELLRDPNQTLIFTGPIAMLYLIFVLVTGVAEPSFDAFIETPVEQTVYWLLIPVFILTIPLSIVFEISSRRERKMMNRLPEALKQLSSANSVGMTLTQALQNTADNTSGILGDEFKNVKNDIMWNHDVNTAMIKLANRVQIPILTRTVKLITEANASTGDIEKVVSIAAKNVETQVRLEKERRQAMFMYTAVILISFVVYLFVIALIDIMFLSTIADMDAQDLGDESEFELSDLPVERFQLVFYHSTIVQAFGSGMIAGYLSSNDVRSGLKFAIVLSLIASGVFYFLA